MTRKEVNIIIPDMKVRLLKNSTMTIKDNCLFMENDEEVVIIPLYKITSISYKK